MRLFYFFFSTFIVFKSVFFVTFHYFRFLLIYTICTYICIYIYILYLSPHCLGCARNDVDIYTDDLTNKAHNNNEDNNNNGLSWQYPDS